MVISRAQQYLLENTLSTRLPLSLCRCMSSCVKALCVTTTTLENVTKEEGHYSLFNIVDFYKKKTELHHIASLR